MALAALVVLGCGEPSYPIVPERPPNPGCFAHEPPPAHERYRLVRAFEGALSGTDARALTCMEEDEGGAFFLTTQGGRVIRVEGASSRVVYDVADHADFSFGENGLVSIALSPSFATDGHAYIVYSAPSDTAPFLSRVARITYDGTSFGDERTVLDVDQFAGTHSGNHVAFGPDGSLYYSIGDDLRTDLNASPTNLPGSVLRLGVSVEPYAIPADNPFADGVSAAPEVFAFGLRNPWRFLFESDGTLLLGDVGQDSREEVDRIVAGGNYGWPTREGTLCFRSDSPCGDETLIDPIVEVTHAEARSIVPGYRLDGRTLFADFNSGTIFSFEEGREDPDVRVEIEGRFPIVSFARGREGVIYVLRFDASGGEGGVYRVEPAPPPEASTFPTLLSETGCVDPDDPREPAGGLFEFTPEAELFSDGAHKRRWLALPDDARIEVADDGDFVMPEGTVLVKHFGFGARLHETRVLMRTASGWNGYSYRWNDAQTDAELLDAGFVEVLPESGVRWQYPRRSQCPECHTDAAGYTLGLEAHQLDDAELSSLAEQVYFVPGLDAAAIRRDRPLVAAPFGTGSVAERARAYLHANCSFCHRPGGPGGGDFDLRASLALAEMGICDVEPQARIWDIGVWEEQRLLAPSVPEHSTIYLRLSTLSVFRMPPLATGVIDGAGASLVAEWIRGVDGCD
jgi:uncharacterized repeat protein (TIGR03806 family)